MTRPGIGLITGVLLMVALPQVLRPFVVAPSTTQAPMKARAAFA